MQINKWKGGQIPQLASVTNSPMHNPGYHYCHMQAITSGRFRTFCTACMNIKTEILYNCYALWH